MPVGGRVNEQDIIHELQYHAGIIFSSNDNRTLLLNFKRKLNEVNTQYYLLGTITTEEQLITNAEYAKKIIDYLAEDIPKLFQNEGLYEQMDSFFKEYKAELDAAA